MRSDFEHEHKRPDMTAEPIANADAAEASPTPDREAAFRRDLTAVINRYSRENGSDTPDFILANYLSQCLAAFDAAARSRDDWYRFETRKSS